MKREIERQAFHLVFGSLIAILIILLGRFYSLALFGILIIFGVMLSELMHKGLKLQPFQWFIQRLERGGVKPGQGTINFLIGTFIALVFFNTQIVFLAVLVLAYCDSFSTLVGIGFGRKKVHRGKSIEGFLAGFLAGFAVTLLFIRAEVGIVTSFVASLAELLAPVDDNIVIPPLASVIIYILTL